MLFFYLFLLLLLDSDKWFLSFANIRLWNIFEFNNIHNKQSNIYSTRSNRQYKLVLFSIVSSSIENVVSFVHE
jgi:hypothetical protein